MRLNLKVARLKKEMTQREVAGRVGISIRSISQYESGKQRPTYENMKILSDFFGVSVDELFYND